MADQIYLNLWVKGFSEESMLDAWRKLLDEFPSSLALPGVRGVAAIPFTWGEAAVFEQVFAEGATIESVVAAAREFQHPDYAYQAAMRWDVWRQKTLEELAETDLDALVDEELNEESDAGEESAGEDEGGSQPAQSANETLGWKRVPMEVSIVCLGPEFDAATESNSAEPAAGNPHFRLELGLDTLFLPDDESRIEGDEDDWEEAALCYRDNITQLLGYIRRIEKALPLQSRLLWSASGEDLSERIRQAYSGA
jgi:hypothetical protein